MQSFFLSLLIPGASCYPARRQRFPPEIKYIWTFLQGTALNQVGNVNSEVEVSVPVLYKYEKTSDRAKEDGQTTEKVSMSSSSRNGGCDNSQKY